MMAQSFRIRERRQNRVDYVGAIQPIFFGLGYWAIISGFYRSRFGGAG